MSTNQLFRNQSVQMISAPEVKMNHTSGTFKSSFSMLDTLNDTGSYFLEKMAAKKIE